MNEADLKVVLCQHLRVALPRSVVFRHEDRWTAGISDISVTWRKTTTWLEVKHANPACHFPKLQTFTAIQLAREGRCWYIIFEEGQSSKRTLIAHPESVHLKTWRETEYTAAGFNYAYVAAFIEGQTGEGT